jgi:hypothetical protein
VRACVVCRACRACRGCQLNAMVATRFEEAREEARRADEITQQTADKAGTREPCIISLLLCTDAHLLLTRPFVLHRPWRQPFRRCTAFPARSRKPWSSQVP